MRSILVAASLALIVASCGGGGPGQEDTSTDQPGDTADAQADSPDTDDGADVADTAVDEAGDPVEEVECLSDGDCDDGSPCTVDTCDHDYDTCSRVPVDSDGDGYPAAEVAGVTCDGGTDCDDSDGDAYPGSIAIDCSAADHDCNDHPDADDDGDGHDRAACGGDDCDDTDPGVTVAECTGVSACCDGCTSLGCWLDPTTGYLWEDPPLGGERNWYAAGAYCDALSLLGLGAGEWHLPTVSEQRTLVRGCADTEDGGGCGVIDSCLTLSCYGTACEGGSLMAGPGASGCYWDPALGGACDWYWSSSPVEGSPAAAWTVAYHYGSMTDGSMAVVGPVRCVRTGS